MKKINDSKIYLIFTIIVLVLTVLLGAISYYSIFSVEPEIARLLSSDKNVAENYKRAYEQLRNPQIFARYENFDRDAQKIKDNLIPYFDSKISKGEAFTQEEGPYLNTLLERRKQGSVLGRNTMVFFFLLTLLGLGFWLYEKKNSVEKS